MVNKYWTVADKNTPLCQLPVAYFFGTVCFVDWSRVCSFCSAYPASASPMWTKSRVMEPNEPPQIVPAVVPTPPSATDRSAMGKSSGIVQNSFPWNGQEHGLFVSYDFQS